MQLPIFPAGTKEINRDLGVQCGEGKVVYLHGHLPVFQHDEKDLKSLRLFTSQRVANGVARSREVVEAFGVPMGTVKRYVSTFRREGPPGFYRSKQRQRSETKLTERVETIGAPIVLGIMDNDSAPSAAPTLTERFDSTTPPGPVQVR